MPDRNNGQDQSLKTAITKAQQDLNREPDTPSHILKTVQQQEERFEKLTRELEQERQNVLHELQQNRLESETGTFASISETEDSFSFRRSAVNESVIESESSIDSKAYNTGNTQLIDSALNALREQDIMEPVSSMHYGGYGNGPDRSYSDYGSPAVNGHAESPGPKQQVKKTTQVTVTKQTVQTRIIHSPGDRDSPMYDDRSYPRPVTNYQSPRPDDHPSRLDDRTPSIEGSERHGEPLRDDHQYDRSYNDTPSDMYVPSVEGGSDRYGTAPRSQNRYDSPAPRYGDRYDERPVEPKDGYNYSKTYEDPYPHDDWESRPPADQMDYNGPYNDSYHPDDITRDTAHEQMAPLASGDRTGSQDTMEYDKYDKDDPQWRTPDLQEIIDYLSHANPAIVANAAGYLQHLTYGDDPIKNKTRSLGGIPLLVELLGNPTPDIHRCACGALRNISYGKPNEENKVAIKNAGGIPALLRLLKTTRDPEIKEPVTGTLWNLSSSEPLKKPILVDGLSVFVNDIIIPDSGWTPENPDSELPTDYAWTGVYTNTTGCLRNVSSSGMDARKRMRDSSGLVDSLVHVIKSAVATENMNNKVVENTMCIIRNLTFKIANEANHSDAVPAPPLRSSPSRHGQGSPAKKKPKHRSSCFGADDSSGCFGNNKKKKIDSPAPGRTTPSTLPRGATWDPNTPIPERRIPPRGVELLFAHEMVRPYLALLSDCSNHVTLEATAGTIQNISSGEWVWALYIRAQLRKEKGLPVLVELLRMENDKIVSAVARALRNLSLDSRNKELVGKYAMKDLVFRLPSATSVVAGSNETKDLSTDTLVAVLNALQELINMNAENSKSLRDASGIEKLVSITKSHNKYPPIIIKSAFQVLNTMWSFKDLRPLYKHDGWDEIHFSPGIWTTAKSPNRSQTLQPPGSERTTSGPAPQRSASSPAATTGPLASRKLDYEASPLPVKSAPPQDEGPPPFSYDSYDRRDDTHRRDHYESYRPPDQRDHPDHPGDEHYASLRQPGFARDSMSAYSDEELKAAARDGAPPGNRDSMSQTSDKVSSYMPEASRTRLPESLAVPQVRDSISAYSEEAPSERSRDDIPMRELNYASIDHGTMNDSSSPSRRGPPVGGVAVFGRDLQQPQDNIVYAQVRKDKQPSDSMYIDSGPAGDSWV